MNPGRAIPVRIFRDGRWQAIDLLELTAQELQSYFSDKDRDELVAWAILITGYASGMRAQLASVSQTPDF